MIPPKVRDAVWERANSCCERCGQGLTRQSEHSVHHRKLKSRGGKDHISNLVLLCGSGTSPGCHSLVHGIGQLQAHADGWLIASYEDPQFLGITHWSGELRVLLPDGTYGEIVWEAS
jgi:hypothetical protein